MFDGYYCSSNFLYKYLHHTIIRGPDYVHIKKLPSATTTTTTIKMAHRRHCIPSSPSSSSHDPSSAVANVRAVVPTTSRVVSCIKPFLLGFVVAVMLIGLASLSSMYALCKDYNPIDLHSSSPSVIVIKDDRTTTIPPTSVCRSSQMQVAEGETEKNGELERNSRRLKWLEKVPFLSKFSRKQKKKAKINKKSNNINEEIVLLPPQQLDPRSCVCHLIWESLGYHHQQENSHIHHASDVDTLDRKRINSLSSEQQQIELQAPKQFPSAFTPEILNAIPQQERLVKRMGNDLLESVSEFERRASLVPWGGPPQAVEPVSFDWYARKKKYRGPSAPFDQIDGGNLLSSYLRIMKWPEDLGDTDFPFKLCKAKRKNEGKGCDASVAIRHTLEFRERYMPWLVTPGIKKANSNGLVYHRGFSPPFSEDENGSHGIVYLRLALKVKPDGENDSIFFVRSMIREFDRAVAASLQRSNGRVGKFNAIVDGKDFTWSSMPSLGAVKTLVAILQDHCADRLGVVILINIGAICEILLKLFLPLITEEVRKKIVMLPHNQKERMTALEVVLGKKENIPIWLGGTDDYDFQVDEYYANDNFSLDEEALEYLATMPYHS